MGREKTPCTKHWRQNLVTVGNTVHIGFGRSLLATWSWLRYFNTWLPYLKHVVYVFIFVRVLFLLHEASAKEKVGEVDVADHYDQVENLAHQELKWNTFIFTSTFSLSCIVCIVLDQLTIVNALFQVYGASHEIYEEWRHYSPYISCIN